MLLDTHDPYKPSAIPWPKLDDVALARLTSLPIWRLAVHIEGYAGVRMQAMAEVADDPLVRDALALNAFEERRHKDVLQRMTRFYGIDIGDEPDYCRPRRPEWMFVRTGYSELIDSFFAFGMFALARASGFLPTELIEVFEPVIQEEARHNLFFANWLAYERARSPLWKRPALSACHLCALASEIVLRVRVSSKIGRNNFTRKTNQTMGFDIGTHQLLALCLTENDRRFSRYDNRLLRPQLLARPVGLIERVFSRRLRPS